MHRLALLAMLVFGGATLGPAPCLPESCAQQWPDIELDRAPIIRGQNYVGQPPVVYFDQDPSTAVLGPVPAGMQASPMAGYGAPCG